MLVEENDRVVKAASLLWAPVTAACVPSGIGSGLLARQAEAHGRDVEEHWRQVDARVVHTQSSTNPADRRDRYWATLEYEDEDGNTHPFETSFASSAYR